MTITQLYKWAKENKLEEMNVIICGIVGGYLENLIEQELCVSNICYSDEKNELYLSVY